MNESAQTRVLVVEDEPVIREILMIILSAVGHDVTIAANGREALAILKDRAFDVMIADIMMPEMDGIEMLKRLAVEIQRQMQVLILTAIDEGEKIGVCPMAHRISKPFNNARIVAKVEELARDRRLSLN